MIAPRGVARAQRGNGPAMMFCRFVTDTRSTDMWSNYRLLDSFPSTQQALYTGADIARVEDCSCGGTFRSLTENAAGVVRLL